VERGKDRSSAVAAEGLIWSRPPSAFLLEYSFQREVKSRGIPFQAEFIRLRVAPVGGATSGLAATANASVPVGRSSLTSNVTRADNGDVVISGVPMVDQGPKGYCAVATAERVFKYYGLPVDQHEMAQIAGSSSDGKGTGGDTGGAYRLASARRHERTGSDQAVLADDGAIEDHRTVGNQALITHRAAM
jgi:hypothetical protein